ncbi:MAG: histone deacetylase [Chitinivibrionales bacterium]|nr:histone deacetylase [Chitinivibrionales bacterium]
MDRISRRIFTERVFQATLAGIVSRWSMSLAKTPDKQAQSHTGLVYDKRCLDHIIYKRHPESPKRLIAIRKEMKKRGLDTRVVPLSPLDTYSPCLLYNHTQEHIDKIKGIPETGAVAGLAVAGALAAVKNVSEGTVRNAFCAIRPPGHHAENAGHMEGFCYYNNVAVAARYAQKKLGHKNILIIDWDYHHGNGTETSFYEDPTVLFFSTHDKRAYPGTGDPGKKGNGAGKGYNINVHLGCRSGDKDMIAAWEHHLFPKLEQFSPDFVLISAGFDSRKDDSLGCFSVSDSGFYTLTRMAQKIADDHCNGRMVSLLEGGYTVSGLARAACAHLEAMML